MFEWIMTVFLAISFALLNSLQVISRWLANKPGFTFTGIAHFYPDYFLYLSQMSQGAGGSIFYYSHRLTNEPLPATWIWWFNGLTGYLGRLAGLSVFASYNLALITLVILLIFCWFRVARLLYPTNRLSRFTFLLFVLTASSFFDLKKFADRGVIENLGVFWFSPSLAFNRLGGVPHQVWQTILMILLTIVFTRVLKLFSIKVAGSQQNFDWLHFASENNGVYKIVGLLVGLVILTLLAASANPITMLVFFFAATMTTYSQIVRRKQFNLPGVIPLLLLGSVALPAAWITNQAFNTVLFQAVKFWEAGQISTLTIFEFLLSLGPIILFIPFAITLNLKNLQGLKLMFIAITLVALFIFFSPIPGLLTTAPARYLSPVTIAGLAILAADGLEKLLKASKHHRPAGLLATILITVYLFFTLFSLREQIVNKISVTRNPILASYLNHVPDYMVQALVFLKNQPFTTRPVVLVEPAPDLDINNLIPIFSDKISFTGHPLHTLYGPQKEILVGSFFNFRMNEREAKLFLNNHRIGFIFAKSDSVTTNYLDSLSFLKKIYNTGGISIYQVKLP